MIEISKKEYYAMRKKAHVCVHCGQEDAFTMIGRSLCAECAKKWAKWNTEGRKKQGAKERAREVKQRLYDRRKEQGLCPYCGRKASIGYVQCERCRAKGRRRTKKFNEIKYGARQRGEYGMCWTCNKKESVGDKRLCKDCIERAMKALDKANRVRLGR